MVELSRLLLLTVISHNNRSGHTNPVPAATTNYDQDCKRTFFFKLIFCDTFCYNNNTKIKFLKTMLINIILRRNFLSKAISIIGFGVAFPWISTFLSSAATGTIFVVGQSDLDRFTYGETVGNTYGPKDWHKIQCRNPDTCVSLVEFKQSI